MPVIIQVRTEGQDENTPIYLREEAGDVVDFDNYPQRGWGTEARLAPYYRLFLLPNLTRSDVDFLSLHDATMWNESPLNFRNRKLGLDVTKIPISADRTEPVVEWDITLEQLKSFVIVKPELSNPEILGTPDNVIG